MRMKRGQPGLDSVKGSKACDHGSVLRFPIMMALIPSSSIRRPTSRLKSAEYSWTRIPYLKYYENRKWIKRATELLLFVAVMSLTTPPSETGIL